MKKVAGFEAFSGVEGIFGAQSMRTEPATPFLPSGVKDVL